MPVLPSDDTPNDEEVISGNDLLVALGAPGILHEYWTLHSAETPPPTVGTSSVVLCYRNRYLPNAQITATFYTVAQEDGFHNEIVIELYLADRPISDPSARRKWSMDFFEVFHPFWQRRHEAEAHRERVAQRWDGSAYLSWDGTADGYDQ